jgi:hypothetical protein
VGLAILIQTDVLEDQPRWCVAQLQDSHTFHQKLEALDHYTRALVLDCAFEQWMEDLSSERGSHEQKESICQVMNEVDLSWLDKGRERPQVDFQEEDRQLESPEWRLFLGYIRPILRRWLQEPATGPLAVVHRLHQGRSDGRIRGRGFGIKMEMYEDYAAGVSRTDCHPTRHGRYETTEEANRAARQAIENKLDNRNQAWKWHEVYQSGDAGKAQKV